MSLFFIIAPEDLNVHQTVKKMKCLSRLKRFFPSRLASEQKGQTIVEFVLLLAVISTLSYGFVAMMNQNLARYWEYSANLIVDDKPGTKTVKLAP